MLTIMRTFMPNHKLAYYGILVDLCIAKAQYYASTDPEKGAYWAKQACKYLLKRIDVLSRAL